MPIHLKRLSKEYKHIDTNPIEGVEIKPIDNTLLVWKGFIHGPINSPYFGGVFPITMTFDERYPVKPPSVKFTQFIFHPNIYRDGKICLDILQSNWSPATNIQALLTSIRSLFDDPNPNSPANRDAAVLYNKDREQYNNKVKEFII